MKFDSPIFVTRPIIPNPSSYYKRLDSIFESQWLSNMGNQHQELENRLTKHLDVPYLSLFNNGTIALITAIQALRLQGEVITTPFTFAATTHALAWNNITPVFCDIKRDDFTIDETKIESLITPKTSAILGVHVFGHPCNTEAIQKIADKYGLRIIYDAAHSFGDSIEGKGIGNFGDVSMFSFHPTKLFHTAEGGALTYKDPNLYERIYLLKNFGIKNENEVVMPGINGKMNELSAAMGIEVLNIIDHEIESRRNLEAVYDSLFNGISPIKVVSPRKQGINPHYYMLYIDPSKSMTNRDSLVERLKADNIYCRKYFSPLTSEFPCYCQQSTAKAVPIAHEISNNLVAIPFYGELKIDDAHYIANRIINLVTNG